MKRISEPIQRVGFIANTDKSGAIPVLKSASKILEARGMTVSYEAETSKLCGHRNASILTTKQLAQQSDFLIVFGGDGTMLRVAREVAGTKTPILGVNIGGLGFLAVVSSNSLAKSLEQVWSGQFEIEERPLLEAQAKTKGQLLKQVAFNDFVLSRGMLSRLVELDVWVDDHLLTRYRCDGLIVCSPTGSTAYSLAAGGAIVHPASPVFTITPICPHTLSNRSVIVGMESTIRIGVCSEKLEIVLSADGQLVSELGRGDEISVTRSNRKIRLLQLHGNSFFETLRYKLKWSGTNL